MYVFSRRLTFGNDLTNGFPSILATFLKCTMLVTCMPCMPCMQFGWIEVLLGNKNVLYYWGVKILDLKHLSEQHLGEGYHQKVACFHVNPRHHTFFLIFTDVFTGMRHLNDILPGLTTGLLKPWSRRTPLFLRTERETVSTMSLYIDEIKLPLSDETLNNLAHFSKTWSLCNGLTVSTTSRNEATYMPHMLFPSPIPRTQYEKALSLQPEFNELMWKVASDEQFLSYALK